MTGMPACAITALPAPLTAGQVTSRRYKALICQVIDIHENTRATRDRRWGVRSWWDRRPVLVSTGGNAGRLMPMTVFVLVHGAWGGAHGFRKVRGPLRAAGHEVFTPSLTGIGERAHLTSPQVCLTTHIADVVNAVWYEDLSDIVLLGFSYGGFVVTGALEHIAERVRHLVYLDAFVPGDGDTLAGLAGIGTSYGVIGLGRDWLVPPLPREFDDPAEAAWA